MSAVNTDLNRFAVFINSKTALYPSYEKNDVVIPFAANLADTDPLKVMKVAIVDVLFSNVFYNIRPRADTLKYLDIWTSGRGDDKTYSITTVKFENGFYDYDSFTAACNDQMGTYSNITFTVSGSPVVQPVYFGFGSAYDAITTNDAVPASAYTTTQAKVFFQTPSLGDMYQPFKCNGTTVTTPGAQSYVYGGKYLIADEETYGLLHLLGFWSSDVADAPTIDGSPYKGYGQKIYSRQVGSTTEYSFDNVYWGQSTADTTFATIRPDQASDFTGLDDLYIHCPQLRTQFLSGLSKSPLQPNDVVCVVPINVGFGDKMSYIPQFPLESFLLNTNITQLQFRMTNSNNEPVNFHGINWGLTMFCEEVDDEAKLKAQNQPIGNLPNDFFHSNGNHEIYPMQQRLAQGKRKL